MTHLGTNKIRPVSLIFYLAVYSLLAWTQIQWAFIMNYHGDLFLRMTLSIPLAIVLTWVLYLFWTLILRALNPGISHLHEKIGILHRPLFLFWLYPLHIKPFPGVLEVNNFLLPLVLSVYGLMILRRCFLEFRSRPEGKFPVVGIFRHTGKDFISFLSLPLAELKTLSDLSFFNGWVRIYPLTWFLIFFQIFFLYTFSFVPSWEPIGIILHLTPGFLAIIINVILIKELSFGNRIASGILTGLFLLWYMLLYLYHASSGIHMNFMLFISNIDLMRYPASWKVIFSKTPLWGYILLIALATVLVLTEKKWKILSSVPSHKGRFPRLILCLVVLSLYVFIPGHRTDEIMSFNKSIFQYYFPEQHSNKGSRIETVRFPFISETNATCSDFKGGKPNIFIIFMESFGEDVVERYAENGMEITPVMNKLIKESLYIEHFYGNSIQTSKGQFVTLAGLLPAIRYKEFTEWADKKYHALPAILNEYGWHTLFMKAYAKLSFDNTGDFVKKLGFQEAHGMDATFMKPGDENNVWGWGLQDDKFFIKVFEHLDQDRANRKNPQPYFVALTTVSHHMMFDRMPGHLRKIYPTPKNGRENFVNSIHLADGYLGEFLRQLRMRPELRNSIVIIMGDHGFPSGQHGLYHNELSYYEEFFRTPCVIYWPGKIQPQRLTVGQYSQEQIAPTILDMAGIKTRNHFTGQSIFCGPQPALLVQPYSEGYLSVVDRPWKFVKTLSYNKEYLYNLDDDPEEKTDLMGTLRDEELVRELRNHLTRIYDNERVCRENRIWDK